MILFINIIIKFLTIYEIGINIVNSLRIFTKDPGEYLLNVKAKQNSFNLLNDVSLVYNLKILECKSDNIKLYVNENLYYCEEPKCVNNCKPFVYYDCIKGENNALNKPNENICQCKAGYTGDTCSDYHYYETR